MSYQTGSTLQEQMAGPSPPRFTRWLTMAPDVDPPKPSALLSNNDAKSSSTSSFQKTQAASSSSSDLSEQPAASIHGFGYLGQKVKLPQRKKHRATFQAGSPRLSEDQAESASGSPSSRASSDALDFDVRASFAPMPVYGKGKPTPQPPTYRGVGDQNNLSSIAQPSRNVINSNPAPESAVMDSSSEEELDGLAFGGRRWKGKTVHAVELELEALRDERLMSHAPDAAYLASRLEGVRRNLEIEERGPTYLAYDEDMLLDEEEPVLAPQVLETVRQLYPFQPNPQDASTLPHRPVSNASSVSLAEGETPHDLDFDLQFDPSSTYALDDQVKVHDPNQLSMPPSSAKTIEPAARAAALDARIQVRPLRRGDLEQVRDLHAFHGDTDRSPDYGETYASTASFLLRLLVDDRHVCLVAVAKPLAAPEAPLPAAADLAIANSRKVDNPASPSSSASSGAATPTSLPDPDDVAEEEFDSLRLADEAGSGLSSSPNAATSSLSSTLGAPVAPQTRITNPRDHKGRINNTPATSVFSDIFAERGHPSAHLKQQHPLPGPVETCSAPVKKVLSLPSGGGVETETILGVVSAQLSVVPVPCGDSLWGQKKEKQSEVGALIDVHLLTLATAPEERGQGLGAKLLATLHGECMSKVRLMAMRLPSKSKSPLPTIPPLSPKFVDEATLPPAGITGNGENSTRSPYLRARLPRPTLSDLKPRSPVNGEYLARMYLEVHPSNVHALALYTAHGFNAPTDDSKAVKRGFYRGDSRISTAERAKRGGTDGWLLQRYDGLLS
ncbi:uncharacterized protein UBRO_03087-A [Ustilago bromivora]|uniref:Uncharacterized protein n=1 Tax=Ustilago bromivora TaxID=307758 RepID=A0A1K0HBX8_9BASI|nr:uncharacterized protein UBRO_03087-A [Ustilago bromivora]